MTGLSVGSVDCHGMGREVQDGEGGGAVSDVEASDGWGGQPQGKSWGKVRVGEDREEEVRVREDSDEENE